MARTSRQTPPETSGLMAHAEAACRRQGMSFTTIRREVFALLCGHERPAGAYDLLEELRQNRPNAAPVTVYRALDFLVSAGLAHRVNTLNAFTACRGSEEAHRGLMLVCRKCSQVIELEDKRVESTIARTAADQAFETADVLIEVLGTCSACQR